MISTTTCKLYHFWSTKLLFILVPGCNLLIPLPAVQSYVFEMAFQRHTGRLWCTNVDELQMFTKQRSDINRLHWHFCTCVTAIKAKMMLLPTFFVCAPWIEKNVTLNPVFWTLLRNKATVSQAVDEWENPGHLHHHKDPGYNSTTCCTMLSVMSGAGEPPECKSHLNH